MKKIPFALAACAVSVAALAQPMRPPPPPHGPDATPPATMAPAHRGYNRGYDRGHHQRKVWVPAHREHGRYVRGHYDWR